MIWKKYVRTFISVTSFELVIFVRISSSFSQPHLLCSKMFHCRYDGCTYSAENAHSLSKQELRCNQSKDTLILPKSGVPLHPILSCLFEERNNYPLSTFEFVGCILPPFFSSLKTIDSNVTSEFSNNGTGLQMLAVSFADMVKKAEPAAVHKIISLIKSLACKQLELVAGIHSGRQCLGITKKLVDSRLRLQGFEKVRVVSSSWNSFGMLHRSDVVEDIRSQLEGAIVVDIVYHPVKQVGEDGVVSFSHPLQTPAIHRLDCSKAKDETFSTSK